LLPDGTVVEDYVTCYSPQYVIVRGGKHSCYKICPRCQTINSQIKSGPHYILSKYIRKEILYQDAACNFYALEDISKYSLNDFYVSLEAMCVRDNPADGQILLGDKLGNNISC
jgi:hypothetical protein